LVRTSQRVSKTTVQLISRRQAIGDFQDGSKQFLHRIVLPPQQEMAHFGTSKRDDL
jgi:hypothetical protein